MVAKLMRVDSLDEVLAVIEADKKKVKPHSLGASWSSQVSSSEHKAIHSIYSSIDERKQRENGSTE